MNYRPDFCPRLRSIDVLPFRWEGQEVFLLRDPFGFTEKTLIVPKALGPVLAALDGTHTLRDLQVIASRTLGQLVMLEDIEKFINTLDQHYFLEGHRFETLKKEILAAFAESPLRPPSHAGKAYPADPAELKNFLADILARWPKREGFSPRALIAPHIDLNLGARGFAAAYQGLSWPEGARVVVLGTGHFLESPLSVLDKDFETPLGTVPCDREFIAELLEREPEARGDILGHRQEHAIEFQVIFLKYLLGDFRLVPILLASPTPETRVFLDRIASVLAELADQHTFFVAGVDFCHLGLRYGDPKPAGEAEKQKALLFDHELLRQILALNADGLYQTLLEDAENHKVCGFGPLYFLLQLLKNRPLTGKILHQEVVDFGPGSIVSFAAAALYDK